MRILALDLATKVGWAAGPADSGPEYGTHKFPSVGREFGRVMGLYSDWLMFMIDHHQPDQVIYEKPITTIHGNSRLETMCLLIGLGMMTEYICFKSFASVSWVNNSTVKKFFVGKGGFGKKTKPYPMTVAAEKRGWSPETTDEADALGIWTYGIECYAPEYSSRWSA